MKGSRFYNLIKFLFFYMSVWPEKSRYMSRGVYHVMMRRDGGQAG